MYFIDTITHEYPVTLAQLKERFPLTLFPSDFAEPFEQYAPVQPVDAPAYNAATHKAVEAAPVKSGGQWVQEWAAVVLAPEELAQRAADVQSSIDAKIEALWQAADRYTSGYISGVAVGILTIGVMQQLPKAMAVSAWSASIWSEYYARKALVTADSTDNHDFSSFGPIPHSVPELQAEVWL